MISPVVFIFILSLATFFDYFTCACVCVPLRLMYFLLNPHTTMYTVEMIFTFSALGLVFIKYTLINRGVFYLCVSVSDQYCM